MRNIGCPSTFVNLVKQLHRNMKARFAFNGTLSQEIAVDNGVKQGDILAPTLFSIYLAMLLSYTFKDCGAGVALKFRTNGKVFNLGRLNTKSKSFECLIRELLNADDADFVAHSEEDFQVDRNRGFWLIFSLFHIFYENFSKCLRYFLFFYQSNDNVTFYNCE